MLAKIAKMSRKMSLKVSKTAIFKTWFRQLLQPCNSMFDLRSI